MEKSPDHGWTLETLKALMDERDRRYGEIAQANEKATQIALSSAEKAVLVAERNAEKWRDNANEWRQAMNDKDRSFVTKNVLWGYFAAILGLVFAMVAIFQKTLGS